MSHLDDIYKKVPKTKCKGKCRNSCGPIHIPKSEMDNIKKYCQDNDKDFYQLPETIDFAKLVEDFKQGKCKYCPYLKGNTCEIYEVRPLICRLWGACETMPCPNGCEVEGEVLTSKECRELVSSL